MSRSVRSVSPAVRPRERARTKPQMALVFGSPRGERRIVTTSNGFAEKRARGDLLSPWTVIALWSIPALLSTLETVTFTRLAGHELAPWRAFVAEAPQWYGWALFTPLIARLGARFPLRRPLRWRNLAIHAGASLAASALIAVADVLIGTMVRPSTKTLFASFGGWFLGGLAGTVIAYFAIVGVSESLRNSARLRAREREASELAAELRATQLAALRMQLQPHFLFNSLNAIMALVRDAETEQAVRALSLLGDVLRATINAGDTNETTLREELDFVSQYLEIERVRFGERLHVTLDVPEQLLDSRVPTFVLQPFVENALKHGVLREQGGNTIAIAASAQNGTLRLMVRDDGRGMSGGQSEGGVGIPNARARLEHMYGTAATLSVSNAPGGTGVLVEIGLPRSVRA
jgi:two-component system, LytTR family, sensor kinase